MKNVVNNMEKPKTLSILIIDIKLRKSDITITLLQNKTTGKRICINSDKRYLKRNAMQGLI